MSDNIVDFPTANKSKEDKKERAISLIRETLSSLEENNIDPDDFILLTTHTDKLDDLIKTDSYDIFHSDMNVREILGMIDITKNHFLNLIQR